MSNLIEPGAAATRTKSLIRSGSRELTHEALNLTVARAAEGFRSLGVAEGDRIALLLRNDFAFFEATLATLACGAYPVPINWHCSPSEFRYIVEDCGAKALVVHRDLLAKVAETVPEGVTVLAVETPPEVAAAYDIPQAAADTGVRDWHLWGEGFDPCEDVRDTSPRASIIYTSGTTGRPKGVLRAPDYSGRALALSMKCYGFAEPGDKVALISGPLYHAAPNIYGRLAIASHAEIVLQPRFDAEEALALIERHGVTHMNMVPTMFVRLLRLSNEIRSRYDLSSLRSVVHGGAPCPENVKRDMIQWFGPIIHEYYGSSETGPIASISPGEATLRPGSVGRPFDGVSIFIRDEAGRDLPQGGTGEVWIRTEANPRFIYLGKESPDDVTEGVRLISVGDIGHLDAAGYLYLSDRKNHMIISGGANIYPAEIEAALLSIQAIGDCAVFGVPDADFGEAVCAYLQPVHAGAEIDLDVVREHLEQKLSKFKVPRVFCICTELPREDSGKIFKNKLRDAHLAHGGWRP